MSSNDCWPEGTMKESLSGATNSSRSSRLTTLYTRPGQTGRLAHRPSTKENYLMDVPLSCPDITDLEVDYVTRVLRSGQLSLGPRVGEFEEKFAAYVGTRYAVAVNSGTSALHLAVRATEIGSGDEVITTSFSFVASSNCVMFERALPVFVDIDPNTFNLDPNEIRRFILKSCVVNPSM